MIRFLNAILVVLAFVIPGIVVGIAVTSLSIPVKDRAVVLMMFSAVVLWVGVGGLAMRIWKERIIALLTRLPGAWPTKFVLGATLFACIEEAITTLMTNLAPVFGSKIGEAYITASTNYIEVIFLHSVIVFIPDFIVWAWLLKRYAFTPSQVFLLFGLTGTLGEAIFGGPQNFANVGMWTAIYGLMVWLPAHLAPMDRSARKVRFCHYPMALFLPILAAIPVALVLIVLGVQRTHF